MSVTQENGLEKICKQPFVVLATSYLQDLHLSAHKTTEPRTRAARRQPGEARDTREAKEAREAQDTQAEVGTLG